MHALGGLALEPGPEALLALLAAQRLVAPGMATPAQAEAEVPERVLLAVLLLEADDEVGAAGVVQRLSEGEGRGAQRVHLVALHRPAGLGIAIDGALDVPAVLGVVGLGVRQAHRLRLSSAAGQRPRRRGLH
jgi:hypothetical protein